ncbi:hypothetical protein BDV18DRAFT_161973 [Aspergillus unguis]
MQAIRLGIVVLRGARKHIKEQKALKSKKNAKPPPLPDNKLDDAQDPEPRESRFILLNLPIDILLLITPYLSVFDRVYLALTCRAMYHLFQAALDDEDLALPEFCHTCRSANWGEWVTLELQLHRRRFLRKLYGAQWRYCYRCLKLHPREYISELRPTPWQKTKCVYAKGIADLCACLPLNAAGGRHLVKWLKTGESGPNGLPRTLRTAFCFQRVDGRPLLLHRCSISSRADAFVRIVTEVGFDLRGQLLVTTTYHVYWTTPPVPSEIWYLNTGMTCCVYNHFAGWIHHVCEGCDTKCYRCRSRFLVLNCSSDGLYWVVQGVRSLGKAGWFQSSRLLELTFRANRPGHDPIELPELV